ADAVARRTVTELAVLVRAPSPHGAVILERESVEPARGYRGNARRRRELHGNQLIDERAVADFDIRVVSPRPDGPIELENDCVMAARRNRAHSAKPVDRS